MSPEYPELVKNIFFFQNQNIASNGGYLALTNICKNEKHE